MVAGVGVVDGLRSIQVSILYLSEAAVAEEKESNQQGQHGYLVLCCHIDLLG